MPKTPAYRKRRDRNLALVTLTDAVTKQRRDYWLGAFGSAESREQYHRIIAEWEAAGRRLPRRPGREAGDDSAEALLLVELLRDYRRYAQQYFDDGEFRSFLSAMRLMKQFFGRSPAAAFGPKKLRLLREAMIQGDALAEPPRRPWSRKYINQQVQRIRRIFKWAVAHEMVPAATYQALGTLEPLKRGRSAARERDRVGPVADDLLGTVLPRLSAPVRALVQLQLLTGARAGELVALRACDLEIDDGAVWTFRPHRHKNAHRERERVIYFGPRAQALLRSFMHGRATTDYLFSPAEAEAQRRETLGRQRRTPLSCGNRSGTNVRAKPRRTPGDHYTTTSYRRAIEYACQRAFTPPAPLARLTGEKVAAWQARLRKDDLLGQLAAWRRAHRFHPHQLRHSAGTHIRREFGLEAAQLALGHASAVVTDAVYAERDREKVIEVMRKLG